VEILKGDPQIFPEFLLCPLHQLSTRPQLPCWDILYGWLLRNLKIKTKDKPHKSSTAMPATIVLVALSEHKREA